MPQVKPADLQQQANAPAVYGTDKPANNVPLQQKLYDLFKPQEFVTIMNIDDEPLYWQYMPIERETEAFSEDGMQRMVNRGEPEMWMINPGEVEVIVGESAYRALDALYKNVMAKSTLKRFNDPTSPLYDEKGQHLPKNFNFADSGAQDAFIKKAYLGKAVPTFGPQEAAPAPMQPATVAASSSKESVTEVSNERVTSPAAGKQKS